MPRTEIPVDPSPEIVALPGSEIERLLCLGRNGALDDLQVAAPDAWAMQLPDLAAFADWPDDAPAQKSASRLTRFHAQPTRQLIGK